MAATTAGALKSLIEGLGLGLSAYRDRAPKGIAPPYVTITEDLSLTHSRLEDGAVSTGMELAQVDLWMTWKEKATTGAYLENFTLPRALIRGLHGAHLATAPTVVYAVLVRNSIRMLEEDANLVHIAITVNVYQVI